MTPIQQIAEHPVYKQVLKDSYGGVLYNVANRDKYDATDIISLWENADPSSQEMAGGIMKGAIEFLRGDQV